MKIGAFAILALASIIGLACGQFAAFPDTGSPSPLFLFLILFFIVFFFINNQTRNVPLNVNNVSTGITIPISG